MLSMSTLGMYRIPFYIEQGISPQLVAWALSVESVVAALALIVTGRVVDRFPPRFVAASAEAIFVVTFIVTIQVNTGWHVLIDACMYGMAVSSFAASSIALWPSYFGGRHIGSIRGLTATITLVFSALGGPITGAVKDATGTYVPVWLVSLALMIVATLLMLMANKPEPPTNVDSI